MVKKIMVLLGLFIILLIVWIAAGLWFSSLYGNAGFGGTLLIGFCIVPLILRLAVTKLFRTNEKTIDH
ncbi:hypothetical protein [Paenibacillus sp. OAS669]|uniref:hypothetical protein n=1 Tax=Paenibacillus sp. OAS669 TaxID=2663821 RepID=UPI00178BA1C7|nr:hypothetical protein [Paenibacillus sp. OAS669]MBE1440705.1 uncharacterized protein YqfA (UPF0365 family) [Paenibacillus sp. OAS669]